MSFVERCWMITSKFSVIAILIITGICFGVFVYPYMKKKREAALVSIVYIGIMSVLYLIPQQIGNFSAYMLGVMAAFLVMYVQDRRNIYQKIFLAVTFFSIRWLAVAMAGRLDDFIIKALVLGNTIAGRQWLQYGLYAGTRILDIVLCIVFLAVAIGLINKAYVYKNDEMNVKELVMLIIPSLVGVTGYGILQYYLNIYEKDRKEPDRYLWILWSFKLCALFYLYHSNSCYDYDVSKLEGGTGRTDRAGAGIKSGQ